LSWRYPQPLPGQADSYLPLRNCPALGSEGRIYATLGRQLVALVEELAGVRVLWKYATGGHIPGSPVVGPDGQIRVHSGDGRLHSLTPAGQAAWAPVSVGEPLGWAAPLVDAEGNTWICSYGGGLARVGSDGAGGSAPFFRSRQKFDCTGLIRDGVLYVGGEDGFVKAIELSAGSRRNRWPAAGNRGRTDWFVNSALARHPSGAIVVASRDEFLYAFDAEGKAIGKLHVRGQMLGSPVIDPSGDIYVGVSLLERGREPRGKLLCIAGDLSSVRWEYPAAGAVESTPVVGGDGSIYFGDNSGRVHAVGPDGRNLWHVAVGSAVRSSGSISPVGDLIFGLDDGTLVALTCQSPGLAVGGWPKYLAGPANCTE
jgi:outer membrane protein assembly factor BamB